MLIQMHIMGMVFNGHFMTIQMFVPFLSMKLVDICSQEQEMSMNGGIKTESVIHSTYRLMLLLKISHFSPCMNPPSEKLLIFLNRKIGRASCRESVYV